MSDEREELLDAAAQGRVDNMGELIARIDRKTRDLEAQIADLERERANLRAQVRQLGGVPAGHDSFRFKTDCDGNASR